ncbi:hypothetical protein [Granulicoccus sp. GXG6511]|uniref:hypothetical protein n=1 Tax=Granulicoccus sp. GXG6511 TaxID=3381351 RepID=UPI003D7E8566
MALMAASPRINSAFDAWAFHTIIFAPFLLGLLLAPVLAAIALWRAKAVPVWAIPVAAVSSIVAGLGSDQPPIAFAPALRHVSRRR